MVGMFALAVGHLAWVAVIGPPFAPDYFIGGGGKVPALVGTDPQSKVLYLRRNYYLSKRPRHAWIKAIAHDELWVLVNGMLVEQQNVGGFSVGVVADIAPFLAAGHNVIGLVSRQATIGRAPIVHVSGVIDLDDGPHPIEVDTEWRCSHVFQRRAHYWMSPEYDDRIWDRAVVTRAFLRAPVAAPPDALCAARRGRWLTPPGLSDNLSVIRREFEVPGRPKHAWIRILCTSSYNLAVNGILVDQQEDQLGTTNPIPPVRRVYDLTSLTERGKNVVALALSGTGNLPHVLVEMEVVDDTGQTIRVQTDDDWQGHSGRPLDWYASSISQPESWQACAAESGDLDMMPWEPRSLLMEVDLPIHERIQRYLYELALITCVGIATWYLTRRVAVRLARIRGTSEADRPCDIAYLALFPTTITIAAAVLSIYDRQIGPQHVYRPLWLACALAAVPLQWFLLAILGHNTALFSRVGRNLRFEEALRAALTGALVLGLMILGFTLRIKDIDLEPLQWDEAENFRTTVGMLQKGMPNYSAHPDQPDKYTETSELTYIYSALAALFTDSDRWTLRMPCVLWSTLAIGLMYWMGREFFSSTVGLIAATIITFAPPSIAMADFGRYFGQLEFFTLLTLFFFWRTIRGTGPIDRTSLWLTAFSFVSSYFTWECGALLAVGMMVAAILQRRGRLVSTILMEPHIWIAMLVCALCIGLQYSHRELQQTLYMWFGISVSDIELKPMWRYPTFRPLYYLWETSYSPDLLVPAFGFVVACFVALRHRFREPMRLLVIVHIVTAMIMACLLPAFAWRYADLLTPPVILECAAAYGAVAWGLCRFAHRGQLPIGWRYYANGVALLTILLIIVFGSGQTIRLMDLPRQLNQNFGTLIYKNPNLGGPSDFLRANLREGDALMASDPQQIHHLLGRNDGEDRPNSYWPANTLFVPATLDDQRDIPIDRRDGTKVVSGLKAMEEVFARHERVWYVACPLENSTLNTPEISAFIRGNMDLVYEDYQSLVFLRDGNHRTIRMRTINERELSQAQANFLK
jgi:hypothetical protein